MLTEQSAPPKSASHKQWPKIQSNQYTMHSSTEQAAPSKSASHKEWPKIQSNQ